MTRPLDLTGAMIVVGLCLTWGFNQVAIKIALTGYPPFIQGTIRSLLAALCVAPRSATRYAVSSPVTYSLCPYSRNLQHRPDAVHTGFRSSVRSAQSA